MLKAKLFESTTQKLIDAFNNGNLYHGKCASCAVGNIVGDWRWSSLFLSEKSKFEEEYTIRTNGEFHQGYLADPHERSELKKWLRRQTGYTWKQLADVEWAFESNREMLDLKHCLIASLQVIGAVHKASDEDMLEVIAQLN